MSLRGSMISPSRKNVGVPVTPAVLADLESGRIRGVLVTSGSVARQIALQLDPLPTSTVVAYIGPRTAFDARAAGLAVHIIAESRSAESLIAALVEYVTELSPSEKTLS